MPVSDDSPFLEAVLFELYLKPKPISPMLLASLPPRRLSAVVPELLLLMLTELQDVALRAELDL